MEGSSLSLAPEAPAPARPRIAIAVGYALFVAVPLAVLVVLLRIGSALPMRAAAADARTATEYTGVLKLPLLLAQIIVILLACRLVVHVLRRFGQPAVIGEMLAGILLGASVLGALAPHAYFTLFPHGTLRFLHALSDIGILMFMFLVGLDLDEDLLRRRGRVALLTSHASIAVPMCLAAGLAIVLFPRYAGSGEQFVPFALFLGAAMSLTAFPVLARILADRGLQRTMAGTVALASAAVDDVTAWCLLAFVTAVARSGPQRLPIWAMLVGLVIHVAIMLKVMRPLLRSHTARLFERKGTMTDLMAIAVLMTLGSAWITELLGVHALFGAFLAGVTMPRDPRIAQALKQRIEDLMVVLLLPLFFAFTGLRTDIRLLTAAGAGWLCVAVLGIAIVGKLGASTFAARVAGLGWRESATVGALMNSRGLMELIILNVGLDLGIITPPIFAMFVLMALVTTLMTTPLVDRLQKQPAQAAVKAA